MSKIVIACAVLITSIQMVAGASDVKDSGKMIANNVSVKSFLEAGVLKEELSPDGYFYSYAYRGSSEKWIRLKNNLNGINRFLGDEITNKEQSKNFVKGQIVNLLVSSMSLDSWILREKFVATVSQSKRGASSGRNAGLRKYANDAVPSVIGSDWAVSVFVLTIKGAVEKWDFGGRVFPLTVSRCKSEIVASEGSFDPIEMM